MILLFLSPQCPCDLSKYTKKDKVIIFLTGLNEQFEVMKSQVLFVDPLLNINKVLSLIFQQERQHGTFNDNFDSTSFANDADGKRGYGKGKNGSKYCTFCGRIGHTA